MCRPQGFLLGDIHHNLHGFRALVSFYADAVASSSATEADMGETRWIDADMCAPFGALIYTLIQQRIAVKLINMHHNVREILFKNGFLSSHGDDKVLDTWDTTITCRRFNVSDEVIFSSYISQEFVGHRGLPKMSTELRKAFSQSVSEVFNNAVLHSQTQLGVFSCGQYFPNKDRLDFTIADMGIGIRQNIKNYTGDDYSPVDAINWATEGNSTKTSGRPGGMGLKFLCNFLDMNKGCVRIVSDSGYWQRNSGKITIGVLPHPFPGTVVNLEVNTADTKSYVLQSELDENNLF